MSQAKGANDDVPVHDVPRARSRQQETDESRVPVIERDDGDVRQAQERGDPRLTRRRPPSLRDASRRNRDSMVSPTRLRDENHDVTIAAIEGNEGSRIEDEPGHAARVTRRRSFRARARSAVVAGPPVSSRLCATRRSKSASAAS